VHATKTGLFVEMGVLLTFLPKLALDLDSPDVCLLSSWDYRREPLHSANLSFILLQTTLFYFCFSFPVRTGFFLQFFSFLFFSAQILPASPGLRGQD
jgi:hypothetical protein